MEYLSRIFCLCLLCLSLAGLRAQQPLSPQASISLFTCAPGDELYSVFGHSALRIKDPAQNLDQVFNWGIFDFDTPNFYLKFIRGQLLYKLGAQSPKRFLREYQYYKRAVTEHTLLLPADEKQAVADFVFNNYKPENRFYRYDFFYDNCASRIVDIIDTVLTPRITWEAQAAPQATFRDLLDPYLDQQPWADLGIDLILGLNSDKVATFRQQMFLPAYIPANFAQLRVDRDSIQTPIFNSGRKVLTFAEPEIVIPWWQKPTPLFWIASILLIALGFWLPRQHFFQQLDLLWFGAAGLAGALFLFMWVGTDHEACYRNLNMLWANPFYLLLLPALRKRAPKSWERILLLLFAVFNLCVILGIQWLPQDLHPAVIPLALLLLVRIGYRLWPTFKSRA